MKGFLVSGSRDGVISQVLANIMVLGFNSAFLLNTRSYTGTGNTEQWKITHLHEGLYDCGGNPLRSESVPGNEGLRLELRAVSK